MPGISGIDAMQAILKEAPGTHIVMLTVSEEADDLMLALRAGALGYLLKNIDSDFLVDSVRRAADGESVMSPEMTAKLMREVRTGAGGRRAAAALAARARDPRLPRPRRQQQGDRARSRRRREHGQDPRPAHPAQARAHQPRAGGRLGGRARHRRQGVTRFVRGAGVMCASVGGAGTTSARQRSGSGGRPWVARSVMGGAAVAGVFCRPRPRRDP